MNVCDIIGQLLKGYLDRRGKHRKYKSQIELHQGREGKILTRTSFHHVSFTQSLRERSLGRHFQYKKQGCYKSEGGREEAVICVAACVMGRKLFQFPPCFRI